MKNKFIITFESLEPNLFGSIIEIKVLQRKNIFFRWKHDFTVKAQCKSWNCFEGYEWYNTEKGNRILYSIEEYAYKQAKKILKSKILGVPIMVDWKSLKEKYPI